MANFCDYFDKYKKITTSRAESFLRLNNIKPTKQRAILVKILANGKKSHFSVNDIQKYASKNNVKIATGTIYNFLNKFEKKGLIKEVVIDSENRFYDTNTIPHYHFYLEKEKKLIDIDSRSIKFKKLPYLPKNKEICGINIIVRLEKSSKR